MTVKSLLDAKEFRKMTHEEAELFIWATQVDFKPVEFSEELSKKLGFCAEVIYKRLRWANTKASQGVCGFLAFVSQGSPGNAVMWCYTLNRLYAKTKRMVTMEDFTYAFPEGFPTEEELSSIWQGQKADKPTQFTDNLLDNLATWAF